MKIEDQVASLELCKRLKELGMKQESLFVWGRLKNDAVRLWSSDYLGELDATCSAFTVAELGEMLPHWAGKLCYSNQLVNRWVCVYAAEHRERFLEVEHTEVADTEADARASMLCYLIENKLIPSGGSK